MAFKKIESEEQLTKQLDHLSNMFAWDMTAPVREDRPEIIRGTDNYRRLPSITNGLVQTECAKFGDKALDQRQCRFYKASQYKIDKSHKACMYYKFDQFCDKCIDNNDKELN